MNTLDLLIIIPLAIGFVFGLFKGLLRGITSIVSVLLGILGARLFGPLLYHILNDSLALHSKLILPLSYFIVFVAVAVALHILTRLLDKMFDALLLGGINKLLGGILGLVKYALIVSIFLNVFDIANRHLSLLSNETKEKSLLYQPVKKIAPDLWDKTIEQRINNDKTSQDK